MAEVFFSIITRQAIRRGSFTSVADLIAAIEAFINGWNDRCHPFTWTKTADEILPKCRPGKKNLVHTTLVANSDHLLHLATVTRRKSSSTPLRCLFG